MTSMAGTGWVAIHQSNERYGSDRSFDSVIASLESKLGPGLVVGPCEASVALPGREHWPLPKVYRRMFDPKAMLGFAASALSCLGRLAGQRIRGRRLVLVNTLALAPVVPLARILGFRVVVFVREIIDDKPRLSRMLLNLAIRPASLAVCNSNATRNWVVATIGSHRSVRVVHNGVRVPAGEQPRPSAMRADATNIVYVGRLSENKGVDLLLKAMPSLQREFPSARLTLVGGGTPGGDAYVEHLHELVAGLGLSGSVEFEGYLDSSAPYFSHADVAVIPSRFSEPFGRTAVEAMMLGAPVVAARTGGLPEIIEDGRSGMLFECDSVEDLALKVGALLRDEARRLEIAVAGQQRAMRCFSEPKMCRRVHALVAAVGA